MDIALTILTGPIGEDPTTFWRHEAVYQSLVRGLEEMHVTYNINPPSVDHLHENVLVLCHTGAGEEAIALQKSGKISTLFLGPNFHFINTPTLESDSIFWITPSEWVRQEITAVTPTMKDRIKVWYAGVDPSYWNVQEPKTPSKTVLVYVKYQAPSLISGIEDLLHLYGWKTKKIIYGEYRKEEFKEALQEAEYAIFVSASESQGIALAEAWSMNVPTFVWQTEGLVYQNHFFDSETAPYLNPCVGKYFRDLSELREIFLHLDKASFSPRSWVLSNMSDRVSVSKLLHIIECNTN